jgi:hypothetical protein
MLQIPLDPQDAIYDQTWGGRQQKDLGESGMQIIYTPVVRMFIANVKHSMLVIKGTSVEAFSRSPAVSRVASTYIVNTPQTV